MKSNAYILGFVCGVLLVALVGIALRRLAKKKSGATACEYDERQAAIRGKGFQLAYFTALIVLVLGGLMEMVTGVLWCDLFVFAMIALWISICVFTTYCVVKEAYFAPRSRRKALILLMAVAGAANLGIGICNALSRGLLQQGRLSTDFVNLLTGACCSYLAVFMLAWTLHDRRQEDSE